MLVRSSIQKVCPCAGGRCLTASISQCKRGNLRDKSMREYSTANTSQSIFSPHVSPWEQVFEEIKEISDVKPPTVNPRSLKAPAGARKSVRAQTATARETQVITDMFSSIFDSTKRTMPSSIGLGPSKGGADMNQLYNKLRSHSQRLRWTTEADQELDRKKEEMELCETDVDLLEWAMREVFAESQRYEQAARPALAKASPSHEEPREPLQLQPSSYPHLLAALMRTFRDKYHDPHLALSMFDHARHLSIASFVFGCTTPAYNELIETRWRCFRDLRGVVDALEEMRVNGVELDNRTRLLCETVRREVGERNLWQEESALGSGEAWELLARLERLSVQSGPRRSRAGAAGKEKQEGGRARKRKWNSSQEMWKRQALEDGSKEKRPFERRTTKSPMLKAPFSFPSSASESLKATLSKSMSS
ncbi:hypothetical protein C8Q77DRAFT_1195720 [Trametes polyzona]|nr:hypothetical protein C8Q77DRAFT_1195720 [Trametes polyzona]